MSTVVKKVIKYIFGEKEENNNSAKKKTEANALKKAFESLAAVKKSKRKAEIKANLLTRVRKVGANAIRARTAVATLAKEAAKVAANRTATRTKGRAAARAAANMASRKIAKKAANKRHSNFLKKMGSTLLSPNAVRSPGAPGSTRKAKTPFRP